MRKPGPDLWLTVLAALLAAAWGGWLAQAHLRGGSSVVDRLEASLTDLRFLASGTSAPPAGIMILAIDDDTVRALGTYPLPRRDLARIIESVAALGPRAVAVDLLLLEAGPPADDDRLAGALARIPSVLAAAALFEHGETAPRWGSGLPVARGLLLPRDPMAAAAASGLVNVATDHGGVPRHVPLVFAHEGEIHRSFVLSTAGIAAGHAPTLAGDRLAIGDTVTRLDLGGHLPVRFLGPRGSLPSLSARLALDGALRQDQIRDRIVVIGSTVTGGGDTFPTPFDPILPGVEVLATAIGQLTTGRGLVRDESVRRVDAAAAILLPAILVALIGWRRTGPALLSIGILVLAYALVTILAFSRGYWMSAALPIAAAIPPMVMFGATRLWLDRSRNRRLAASEALLRRFQSPTLADRFARDPNFLAEPIAREIAVVFVDLTGFTGLSERLGPVETRRLLKEFHGLVEEEVTRCDGIVVNFMGDGAMAVFGLLDTGPADAQCALSAATGLARRTETWAEALGAGGPAPIGVKVGAHLGPAVLSRLGAEGHEQITASGDSVNVAARLLEVAKAHGAVCAVSDDLFRAAADGEYPAAFGPPREVAIRGRTRRLRVRFCKSCRSEGT